MHEKTQVVYKANFIKMKEEQIDRYVLNKMSPEERASFEQVLLGSPELQNEVALHCEVVRAIRLKAAREHLRQVEATYHKTTPMIFRRIIQWSGLVAVAACCAVGIFVHYDNSATYREYGNNIVLVQYASRGADSNINTVMSAIDNKEFELALTMIEEFEKLRIPSDITLHIDIQEQMQIEYTIEQDDLRWCKAVVYMRTGKWIKARRLLKQIATSDSYYKEVARKALEEL